MTLARGLASSLVIGGGGGGSTPDPELSYPAGTLNWTAKSGDDFGPFRRASGTVATVAGDNTVRGVLPQDMTAADALDYDTASDLLWLPWFGGCLSHVFSMVANPGYLRKTVSEGAYDWTVGGVFSCCNYEGLNTAGTAGGGIFNFETSPLTDNFMGVSLLRKSSDSGLLTFRRQATQAVTTIYPYAGNNAFLITSTASGLTLNVNGVISTYAALGATQAAGSGPTLIQDIEFGRALNATTNTTFATTATLWAHGMYSGTALTPTEQAAAMAMLMEYFEIPASSASATVCIGDSLMGFSGDITSAGLTCHTGGLATQIASANTSRIVYAACHGAYIPSEIVSPTVSGVDRVVHRYGVNAAYRMGVAADPIYVANQAARRLAILAEIEDRLDAAKTQYPDAAHWFVLPTAADWAQYAGTNATLEADYTSVRDSIIAADGTGVWAGVTQVDAGFTYAYLDKHIDAVHDTSGNVARILSLMPGVVA